jgi:hypothetical protein
MIWVSISLSFFNKNDIYHQIFDNLWYFVSKFKFKWRLKLDYFLIHIFNRWFLIAEWLNVQKWLTILLKYLNDFHNCSKDISNIFLLFITFLM